MIINKGEINELVVSAYEEVTLTGTVYFLWEFINASTNVKYYCLSLVTNYYSNREGFLIEDITDPDGLLSQVDLPEGDYTFNIYQQLSSTNLLPANTTPAIYKPYVHTGKATVLGTSTEPTQYTGGDQTNTSYEG